MPESIDTKEAWEWLRKAHLKIRTVTTDYAKHHIDISAASPLCRMCEEKGETVHHIISGCKKMTQKKI